MHDAGPVIPDDGIIVCSRCGRQVDLTQPDSEAFACARHDDLVFCSHNCLREHLLTECEDDDGI